MIVYTVAGEVLLLHRRNPTGFWQSVTGSLEWDEDPRQAARRELWEETGLRADPVDCKVRNRFPIVPPWRRRYAPGVRENREYVFALLLSGRRRIRLNRAEHRQFRWLPKAAALSLATSWTNREAIQQLVPGPSVG